MTKNAAMIVIYVMIATAVHPLLAGIHAATALESATPLAIERIQEDSWGAWQDSEDIPSDTLPASAITTAYDDGVWRDPARYVEIGAI